MKYNKKKLLIFLFLILLFIYSCQNEDYNIQTNVKESVENKNSKIRIVHEYGWNTKIRVFEIDNCEYIGFDAGSEAGTSIIHKQNCKFCEERNKK